MRHRCQYTCSSSDAKIATYPVLGFIDLPNVGCRLAIVMVASLAAGCGPAGTASAIKPPGLTITSEDTSHPITNISVTSCGVSTPGNDHRTFAVQSSVQYEGKTSQFLIELANGPGGYGSYPVFPSIGQLSEVVYIKDGAPQSAIKLLREQLADRKSVV